MLVLRTDDAAIGGWGRVGGGGVITFFVSRPSFCFLHRYPSSFLTESATATIVKPMPSARGRISDSFNSAA